MKPTDDNFDGRAIFSGHYSVSTSKKGPDTTQIDSMNLFCAIGPFGVAGGCPTMEKVPIGSVVTAEFVHYNALIGSGYVLVSLKNDANDRVFNQSVGKILDSWNKYAIFWVCMYLAAAAYGLFLS